MTLAKSGRLEGSANTMWISPWSRGVGPGLVPRAGKGRKLRVGFCVHEPVCPHFGICAL